MDRRRLLGVALAVASACGYGSGALFAKSVYGSGIDWLALLYWRFLIGGLLVWAWALLGPDNRNAFRKLPRRRVVALLALGAFFVGNASTYYAGLEYVSASLAALIVYIYPALVAVLSIRWGRGLHGRRPWVALLVVTAGVALTIGGIQTHAEPIGLALIVASPIIYSVYIILAARLAGERRGETAASRTGVGAETRPAVAASLMLTGTFAVVATLAVLGGEPILPGQVPGDAWFGLVGIAVFSTALAISAFYAATARIGAAQTALVSTVEPVWTITLATLLFGESLAPIQLVGGVLVIGGVILAQTTPGATPDVVLEEAAGVPTSSAGTSTRGRDEERRPRARGADPGQSHRTRGSRARAVIAAADSCPRNYHVVPWSDQPEDHDVTTPTPDRMPALYIGHGAPTLVDDPVWPAELAAWGRELPRPRSILMVSAHWESQPLTVGATSPVPLVYDFYGFPERYYRTRYDAPGAPDLATSIANLVGDLEPVVRAPDRGLDHGAYIPLTVMYPDADIPVLQMSMPDLDPEHLFAIGKRLAPLRDEGVLIVGSGFLTHGLPFVRDYMMGRPGAPTWSMDFDRWAAEALSSGDVDALFDFRNRAPGMPYAHPTVEHFAPLFVTLGAASVADEAPDFRIDGYWYGLAKRSFAVR